MSPVRADVLVEQSNHVDPRSSQSLPTSPRPYANATAYGDYLVDNEVSGGAPAIAYSDRLVSNMFQKMNMNEAHAGEPFDNHCEVVRLALLCSPIPTLTVLVFLL